MTKLSNGEKVFIIAATAIGVNVFESMLVPNFVEQKLDRNWKFTMPSARTFGQTMLILGVTAFAGGMIATAAMNYIDTQEPTI